MTEQNRDWLTMTEAAEHYRTAVGTLRYWRHIGTGPQGVKVGTRVLFHRSEIERYDRELAQQADGREPVLSGRSGSRGHRGHRGSTRQAADADLAGDAA